MPLVKIFARHALKKPIPLPALQASLCDIWGTEPGTTKLMLTRVDDWTDESFSEDCYVDIRAKGTVDRTRDAVVGGMKRVQEAFAEHDLVANVRLETYAVDKFYHLAPPRRDKS